MSFSEIKFNGLSVDQYNKYLMPNLKAEKKEPTKTGNLGQKEIVLTNYSWPRTFVERVLYAIKNWCALPTNQSLLEKFAAHPFSKENTTPEMLAMAKKIVAILDRCSSLNIAGSKQKATLDKVKSVLDKLTQQPVVIDVPLPAEANPVESRVVPFIGPSQANHLKKADQERTRFFYTFVRDLENTRHPLNLQSLFFPHPIDSVVFSGSNNERALVPVLNAPLLLPAMDCPNEQALSLMQVVPFSPAIEPGVLVLNNVDATVAVNHPKNLGVFGKIGGVVSTTVKIGGGLVLANVGVTWAGAGLLAAAGATTTLGVLTGLAPAAALVSVGALAVRHFQGNGDQLKPLPRMNTDKATIEVIA